MPPGGGGGPRTCAGARGAADAGRAPREVKGGRGPGFALPQPGRCDHPQSCLSGTGSGRGRKADGVQVSARAPLTPAQIPGNPAPTYPESVSVCSWAPGKRGESCR